MEEKTELRCLPNDVLGLAVVRAIAVRYEEDINGLLLLESGGIDLKLRLSAEAEQASALFHANCTRKIIIYYSLNHTCILRSWLKVIFLRNLAVDKIIEIALLDFAYLVILHAK
ncbi:hypothetical protein D3C78_1609220 [compost metagenome]